MGPRVLLVDDEAPLRVMLAAILETAGYQVSQASKGAEALALAVEQSFDLIITDIQMPEMDGIALADQLLSRGLADRIVFISGYCEAAAVRDCMVKCAAADLVSKPFAVPAFLRSIESVLAAPRKAQLLSPPHTAPLKLRCRTPHNADVPDLWELWRLIDLTRSLNHETEYLRRRLRVNLRDLETLMEELVRQLNVIECLYRTRIQGHPLPGNSFPRGKVAAGPVSRQPG